MAVKIGVFRLVASIVISATPFGPLVCNIDESYSFIRSMLRSFAMAQKEVTGEDLDDCKCYNAGIHRGGGEPWDIPPQSPDVPPQRKYNITF